MIINITIKQYKFKFNKLDLFDFKIKPIIKPIWSVKNEYYIK